eukprot:958796-Rhodomonas_salina.3
MGETDPCVGAAANITPTQPPHNLSVAVPNYPTVHLQDPCTVVPPAPKEHPLLGRLHSGTVCVRSSRLQENNRIISRQTKPDKVCWTRFTSGCCMPQTKQPRLPPALHAAPGIDSISRPAANGDAPVARP